MKGVFITFEGIEGSGKSTQMRLLADSLASLGKDCLLTREPGGPPISERIRDILLDADNHAMLPETEVLLYAASRAQHTGQWIIPALKEGKIVLCDRYYDSTSAYQGAARSLNRDFILPLTDFATFHTVPDLTFLLDLPVEQGLARINSRQLDRLERESVDFHQRVRQEYLELATRHAERFTVLDAALSKQEIHARILDIVLTQLGVCNA